MTRYGARRTRQAIRLGMEQKQQEWMQAVTEALSDLLAARVAQATLLEAMMVSHPDPVMLRKAWDELSSQRIAYVAQKKAVAADPRPMDAYTLEQFQAWEEKLSRYFPRAPDAGSTDA
ncbi:hypothetical protein [Xanthomonas arboricola]|uniref:hypothetical protein n=1 Tax=Xanthomonas arboricola TaxID=56448 RepID=UPI00061A2EAC|nr:hypothetical protein [Xanthomonas arboricola]AKC77557.1 hypothetical protein XB05_01470 [Xanthomonas arboricola]KPN09506.1 hypothetical protein AN651_01285 [Xanthomonas arboricola]PMR88351.1 hypothetical protein C1H21_04020 [Xanthomonas arboricola pv. juglandis]PPT46943.1 hypothetical protein XarjCFBP7652_15315 [Xanthomonas arboricola]PPU53031.1 hypothetical protein XarbCFBP6827_16855 [Xanthomonas arboricola]